MTDEDKKANEDEVSEEQLEDVSGGIDFDKAPPKSYGDDPTRNKYFDGQLLDEKDLEEEQKYPGK
jgi:hypothetical protein